MMRVNILVIVFSLSTIEKEKKSLMIYVYWYYLLEIWLYKLIRLLDFFILQR